MSLTSLNPLFVSYGFCFTQPTSRGNDAGTNNGGRGRMPEPQLIRGLEAAWAVLAKHGRDSTVDEVRSRLHEESTLTPTVVVVGEAKRGKSSLVNSLIGIPNVAPTGSDIVTGAYVAYVPANVGHELTAITASVHFADGSTQDIEMAELPEWVTVTGDRGEDPRGVVGATVNVGISALIDVTLMDTPGVSGLLAGHGQISLRAARQAAALLFVTDAGQDFTAPEAAFLEQAAATVETVIFAVTKIDKHPVSWETIIDQNRSLLARHVPRFADAAIVGVSSSLAEDALRNEDPDISRALREESGIDELIKVIRDRVSARSSFLAVRNALRSTVTELRSLEMQVAERLAAVKTAKDSTDVAIAEKEELRSLKSREQRSREDMQLAMDRARRDLLNGLESQFPELEHSWKVRIAGFSKVLLRDERALKEQAAALAGDLGLLSSELTDLYLTDITDNVTELFAEETAKLEALSERLNDTVRVVNSDGITRFEAVAVPGQSVGQLVLRNALTGYSLTNLLPSLVSHLGFGSMALGPLALPLAGIVTIAMTVITRGNTNVENIRAQFKDHMTKAVSRSKNDIRLRAEAAAAELRPELVQAVREYFSDRETQLSRVIKESMQAAHGSAAERIRQTQTLNRQLDEVIARRTPLERLLLSDVAASEEDAARRQAVGSAGRTRSMEEPERRLDGRVSET